MERFIHVEHGFGPCYAADSTRLFLGTMASPKSREAGFFYMHPRNRFWPIMQALFAVRAEGGPAVPQIQRADARVQWHPCI